MKHKNNRGPLSKNEKQLRANERMMQMAQKKPDWANEHRTQSSKKRRKQKLVRFSLLFALVASLLALLASYFYGNSKLDEMRIHGEFTFARVSALEYVDHLREYRPYAHYEFEVMTDAGMRKFSGISSRKADEWMLEQSFLVAYLPENPVESKIFLNRQKASEFPGQLECEMAMDELSWRDWVWRGLRVRRDEVL